MSNTKSDDEVMYPPIEPFFTGTLKVSEIHDIYYEQCGNPKGIPVLFIHGGPGGQTSPRDRTYFDPQLYHIVLYHQRGAGNSTPPHCLEDNDTWVLVEDIEKLRKKLGINRWLLFGGSWGSTLALAYSEKHIERVSGLILRGIFTCRKVEVDWAYGENGAASIYPDQYEKFIEPIPIEERGDIVKAYYKRFIQSGNEEEQFRLATTWNTWELYLAYVRMPENALQMCKDDRWNLAHALIEAHYFVNDFFFMPNQLLNNASVIAKSGIPVEIVQGRYDMCCPMKTAYDLNKAIPQSVLHIMPIAGHSIKEIGTGVTEKLIEICDKLKTVLKQ